MSSRFRSRQTELPPSKACLIEKLLPRFKVGERAVFVDNQLSTRVLCFPSDREFLQAPWLTEKIDHALEHAAKFSDLDTLNALYCTSKVSTDSHAAIALYLYLADAASHYAPNKTLLTAMRQAGARVSPFENVEGREDETGEKIKHALALLGMEHNFASVIDEWKETGGFTVAGQRQYTERIGMNGDAEYKMHGAYPRLSLRIAAGDPAPTLNRAISYALANRHKAKALTEDGERLAHTEALIGESASRGIDSLVHDGTNERRFHFKKLIGQLKPENVSTAASRQDARGILNLLSPSMLELLWRKEYTVAYADKGNIDSILPEEPWHGITPDLMTKMLGCKGLHENFYRTIFTSNGYRRSKLPLDDDTRYRIVAQSLGHECLHSTIQQLDDERIASLREAVEALAEDVRRLEADPEWQKPFVTIDESHPLNVLDKESPRYKNEDAQGNVISGYYPNQRWEEVACEIAGLECGERERLDRLTEQVPSLAIVRDGIAGVLSDAVAHCREKDRQIAVCPVL